ncbi:glycosyltransferase family 2 protein [Flavobacterium sp. ABG]|uniref:glycosyltransferase family 2 protein n=1 Tax=Flavobacterium sp. ABG TaxID=1423322 RepID=UPI00064A6597|nr:glycosyltransferase [Flavobacterium sp. ABG]KLT71204.1 hypothetical protein AB674_04495 [Flavobacterium sp. ABG]
MITYGHESFIEEAINSVLMQEVDFDFELIISNDASPDNTDEIVRSIIKNHPLGYKIRYIKQEFNIGMMPNSVFILKECKGEFIAVCEGDDYWTDPLKLQKQVDFLENNPGFSLCFHNAILKSGENERKMLGELSKQIFNTDDILGQWFIPTASIVFRNYPDFVIPDWFVNCQSGDIPLLLLLSLRGDFKYIDAVMSTYRHHAGGISNTHREYSKVIGMVYIYQSFNFHTNLRFDKKVKEAIIYEIQCHLPEIQELKTLKRAGNTVFRKTLKRLKNKAGKLFR